MAKKRPTTRRSAAAKKRTRREHGFVKSGKTLICCRNGGTPMDNRR